MVMTYEYRIVLPFSVEEYRIAQLYMVMKFSEKESDGDDGVEILVNEPYEDETRKGQFTHKLYHLNNKLPSWIVALAPAKALVLEEKSWNSYPYCKTILTNQYFSKFRLEVETLHSPDRNENDNALKLSQEDVEKRVVEYIDIGNDAWDVPYNEAEDPSKFTSKLTNRGPLTGEWQKTCDPVMTAYKLVTVEFPYMGLGSKVEKYIAANVQRRLQTDGNRKAFCWIDNWINLTMEDIRALEKEIFEKMNQLRIDKANNSNNAPSKYSTFSFFSRTNHAQNQDKSTQ